MTAGSFIVRPDALDYLAGLSLQLGTFPPETSWQVVPSHLRRLRHIRGIAVREQARRDPDAALPLPTVPLLTGLAGEDIPLAFHIAGGAEGVAFALGTWGASDDESGGRHAVLASLLDSIYPVVDGADVADTARLDEFPFAALAYGVPGRAAEDERPWDRLLRGLSGCRFTVVVLAEPVPAADLARLRDTALEDLRVARAAQNSRADVPLTEAYGERVKELVTSLDRALLTGGWRTAVYLLGDKSSFWRLVATWRGVFSAGDRSTAPLRVVRSADAARLADGWVLPNQEVPRGPRVWRHPYLNQTLLDTDQLATYVHLPTRETPGFTIRPAAEFAVSHGPKNASRALRIGEVMTQQTRTGTSYRIDFDDLTRHAFVAGLTGSGKTNTLMHLLTEAGTADVPFLVIEPAKTEYRELLARRPGVGDSLRVFTLGREQVAPLRLNPFEVPDGTHVATHLDLLKTVFSAAFPMWVPLPQVLEQCLVQLYTERGWDLATGEPRDGRSTSSSNVPTLGELVASVTRTVPTLGYKAESTQEITAALTTSLNALRRGSRGLMLDVERSIPIGELLRAPTVVELEGLGDDADKAFVMGLLLIRLYEHRRAEHAAEIAAAAAAGKPAPARRPLRHLVVVEEAHRLLAQSHKTTDSWHADPQGAFADAFSQMLSEIRAYGQGMVIADQVPVRLAPDVLKNTNLKIAHRLVAGDDRKAMAAAMSLTDEQSRVLSTLPLGRAAVFSEGDHTAVLVDVDPAKGRQDAPAVDDLEVSHTMAAWRADPSVAPYFDDNLFCSGVCRTPSECRVSRQQAEEPAGRLLGHRLFNAAMVHTDGLDAVWPDVVGYVSARTPSDAGTELAARVHAFTVHAMHAVVARRATQGRWPPAAVERLTVALRDAVAERVRGTGMWLGATTARRALVEAGDAVVRRTHDPYRLCPAICSDGTCRYRDSVSDVLLHPRYETYEADLRGQADPVAQVRQVAENVAVDVTADPTAAPTGVRALVDARWRAIGCAAQVKFAGTDHPEAAEKVVADALAAAGWVLEPDARSTSGEVT